LVYKKKMKARIHITLKTGVLDPQGKAIQTSLGALGFDGVDKVRQGKFIELDIAADGETEARERLTEMCEQLLANTVIENYTIELEA
jgi:phosphoribosylformylglycinamidine synthase subunit PurS